MTLKTSNAVILIGLTLLPVSMDWASGGDGASDYGSLTNISIAMFVNLLRSFKYTSLS